MRAIGPKVTYIGASGLAVQMKIAVNLLLMVEVIAFGEAVALAEKGGVSREVALDRAPQEHVGDRRPDDECTRDDEAPLPGTESRPAFAQRVDGHQEAAAIAMRAPPPTGAATGARPAPARSRTSAERRCSSIGPSSATSRSSP